MHDRELVGQTLGERYHLLQLLGAGGMGAVYRAHDRELDELIALKVIRSDRAAPRSPACPTSPNRTRASAGCCSKPASSTTPSRASTTHSRSRRT